MSAASEHGRLTEALRKAALKAPALTSPQLRLGAAARAIGGPGIDAPYDMLAKQIGEAAYRVTNAQVGAVLTAAVGAGLQRWDLGIQALREAIDAAE